MQDKIKVVISMIINRLKSLCYWLKEKSQAAWSWLRQNGPETREKAQARVRSFLTEPLNPSEYALLRRTSALMGTSAAIYVVTESGVIAALTVTGLCLGLALGLYKITGTGKLPASTRAN